MRTDLASTIKASLMRLNSGGSHNTAKLGVIVFENDASNGGSTMNPRVLDAASELRFDCTMVQFS
jgi:hypothetical protein